MQINFKAGQRGDRRWLAPEEPGQTLRTGGERAEGMMKRRSKQGKGM